MSKLVTSVPHFPVNYINILKDILIEKGFDIIEDTTDPNKEVTFRLKLTNKTLEIRTSYDQFTLYNNNNIILQGNIYEPDELFKTIKTIQRDLTIKNILNEQ